MTTAAETTTPARGVAQRLARALPRVTTALFLVSVVAIPFMQPFVIRIFGSAVQIADALFGLVAVAWGLSLLLGGSTLRRGRFYLWLGLFFGAVCLTTAVSPARNLGRLLIEIYLIGLSVLAYNLVRTQEDLRRTWAVWTGTAAFTALAILVSVVLFYAAGLKDPKTNHVLWTAGSLPTGNYPRVRGFFLNGNMTGNYLAVSACFAFGLAAVYERHRRLALAAGLGIGAASLFTLSTALGGLAIAVGLFAWLFQKGTRKSRWLLALLPLAAVFAAVLLGFTAAYPKRLETGVVLAASPRWLTWASSWHSFLLHPWTGNGLGAELADVHYDTPRGVHEHLTDPHNAWLSLAGQMGLLGLFAFLLLLAWLARGLKGLAMVGDRAAIARAALLGALAVIVYQGFSCSLEDMRHVWLLFGLVAGVAETELRTASSGSPPPPLEPGRSAR
jgi:O-antigen ligase